MSGERRNVRATLDFFRDLDRQLRSERGPNGEPSTSDFQFGQESPDGSVELIALDLDTDIDWS